MSRLSHSFMAPPAMDFYSPLIELPSLNSFNHRSPSMHKLNNTSTTHTKASNNKRRKRMVLTNTTTRILDLFKAKKKEKYVGHGNPSQAHDPIEQTIQQKFKHTLATISIEGDCLKSKEGRPTTSSSCASASSSSAKTISSSPISISSSASSICTYHTAPSSPRHVPAVYLTRSELSTLQLLVLDLHRKINQQDVLTNCLGRNIWSLPRRKEDDIKNDILIGKRRMTFADQVFVTKKFREMERGVGAMLVVKAGYSQKAIAVLREVEEQLNMIPTNQARSQAKASEFDGNMDTIAMQLCFENLFNIGDFLAVQRHLDGGIHRTIRDTIQDVMEKAASLNKDLRDEREFFRFVEARLRALDDCYLEILVATGKVLRYARKIEKNAEEK